MATVTTKDDKQIYNKDWGSGRPVVFSHAWSLSADAWEAQMMFLSDQGYRTIGHDRRGHGRSSQPWHGNEMDTYADDLAALIEHLDLKDAILVGHSTGGGEVTRNIGRHGTRRVEGGAGRRRAAAHTEDQRQPRRPAARRLRWHPRRLAERPLAALQGSRRRAFLSVSTGSAPSRPRA